MSLPGEAASKSLRWALLSDTHIAADIANEYRGFRPYENLRRVVPEVAEWKPEGLLIDGDLARWEGLAADYAQFQQTVAPLSGIPTGLTLGNHDNRANFLAALGNGSAGQVQPVKDKHVIVIEQGGLRMILLDSMFMVNVSAGMLGKEQRTWLDQYLQASDATPVLLFVHHTLDDDDIAMVDAQRFLTIAARHRKVKAVFYGHSHRYAYDTFEGVHLVNLPAVGYNFVDSEPVGWVQAKLSAEGAELTLQAMGGNRKDHGKTHSLAWRS